MVKGSMDGNGWSRAQKMPTGHLVVKGSSIFWTFPAHTKMGPNGPKWGLLIQTLPTCWAERIWILIIFVFFWIPNFWISRSPDFQKSGLGQEWAWPEPEIAGAPSAAAPDHKVGEIQGTRTIP